MVRETSIESYQQNNFTSLTDLIVNHVYLKGQMSRKMIAVQLGIETATVSGIVTPLLADGILIETDKQKCAITGRNVYYVKHRDELPKAQPCWNTDLQDSINMWRGMGLTVIELT